MPPSDFGFPNLSARDKLKQIRPSVPQPVDDMEKIDAAAEKAGFVSRESVPDTALPARPGPEGIAPAPSATAPPLFSQSEARAASSFPSAEQAVPASEPFVYVPQRRSRNFESPKSINMQVPRALRNVFVKFCDVNRYTYPEGLEELMIRAGLVER
jgi:hypothetical protein